MSEEDFIYSAITDDNMNAFDLNVIASSLANTDKLVRQNKQQKEENDQLREKISSLRESALQIKNLYEAEMAKAARAEAQLAKYVSQCKELEERCLEADSDKINADLILMERLAENDRGHEENEKRYQTLLTDVIRYFSLSDEPTSKRRDLKQHLATLDVLKLPDDVKAFIHQAPAHRSRRKNRLSKPVTTSDQSSQTTPPEMRTFAINTEEALRPDLRHFGTDPLDASELSLYTKQTTIEKIFCDKGTMHTTSTITRATCTSVFIKHVDVGVNFPEVTHKSVDEILRECVPLPPLLLTPITEILPMYETVGIQTDPPVVPSPEAIEKPTLVSCGTITSLKNIRKRIDYRVPDGWSPFQQQYSSVAEQLYEQIKKEELTTSGFSFDGNDTFENIHPRLSMIWSLLGETIFMLTGSGRRFDGQCYNMLNEQLATIRDMIEADGRRESDLMREMFSNVRATVVAAASYGKEKGSSIFPVDSTTRQLEVRSPRHRTDYVSPEMDCSIVGEKTGIGNGTQARDVEKPFPPAHITRSSQTKDIKNSQIASSIVINPESTQTTQSIEVNGKMALDASGIVVAQSIALNGVEPAANKCSVEEKQTGAAVLSLPQATSKPSPDKEDDEDLIAQQLRMMEEGIEEVRLRTAPQSFAAPLHIDTMPSCSKISVAPLEAELSEIVAPQTQTDDEERLDLELQSILALRPGTPPTMYSKPASCSRSTATFVSPIKVKETNQLVKDQFKTPTNPPISKRKLRLRKSDESANILPLNSKRIRLDESCTGRTSPTTEFLLEDDWDQKFSSIKAAMLCSLTIPSSLPLSPIADRFEDGSESLQLERLGVAKERDSELDEEIGMDMVSSSRGNLSVPSTVVPIINRIEPEVIDDSPQMMRNDDSPTIESPPPESSIYIETQSQETRCEESIVLNDERSSVSSKLLPVEEEKYASDEAEIPHDLLEDGEIVEVENEVPTSPKNLAIEIPPEADLDISVRDSPMSPPPHEIGIAAPKESRSVLLDSPLSPPLPCDSETVRGFVPRTIPLHHAALHQQLRHKVQQRSEPVYTFIARYNQKRWIEILKKNGKGNQQDQPTLQQLSGILTRYLKHPDWTEEMVNETISAVLNCTQDTRIISTAVLDIVVSCGDIAVNVLCSPPAPALPITHQKLILVIRHLAYGIEKLDEVIMRDLNRRLFKLKGDTIALPALIALTFLYIGLEDSIPSEFPWKRHYGARLYIFKCLYYFGFKCLPLVYYVLRAFPFALPKKGSPHYDNADAMIATLRTILMNVNYAENGMGSADAGLYRKRELLWLLKNTYGYQQMSPTYEELVVNLVEKIRANKLRNVAYSLILVAKRNGYEWARLHIIQKRIYPLLNEYLKQFELMRATAPASGSGSPGTIGGSTGGTCQLAPGLDEQIVTCIFTIASIMKTQPSCEDATRVMQIFTTIVQIADGHPMIQEEAIAGLIKFSRFGFEDVFQRLSGWNPAYPISDRIKLMLTTMVYRKPSSFWRQLIDNRIV